MTLQDMILFWGRKNIVDDLRPYLLEISVKESIEKNGKDEIAIRMHNKDNIFLNAWFPEEGATIQFYMKNYPCGLYSVDQVDFQLSPATVSIRGLSYPDNQRKSLTKKRSLGFEKIPLKRLAEAMITKAEYTPYVQCPDVQLDRFDVSNESLEHALARLADTYNCAFAVKGRTIVFANFFESSGQTIHRHDCNGSISVAPRKAVASVQMDYYDPNTEKTVKHIEGDPNATGDQIKTIHGVARTLESAKQQCQAALQQNQESKITASIEMEGRLISPGISVALDGFGKLNDNYKVERVSHRISTSGWRTRLQLGGPYDRS